LCLGWRSVADTVAELSRCTFNYLPQPFESDWQNFAALSFPSKTTTYLAAGAPVLIHAPGYASLPRFCADHPIAITVGDLDGDALRRAIESLATDPSLRERLRRSGRDALDTVFSPDTFRRSFMEFLDA
jgi:glycosyltransferase involved in cell wall biosynthesis